MLDVHVRGHTRDRRRVRRRRGSVFLLLYQGISLRIAIVTSDEVFRGQSIPERGRNKPQPQPTHKKRHRARNCPSTIARLQWLGRSLHRARIVAGITVPTSQNFARFNRTRP